MNASQTKSSFIDPLTNDGEANRTFYALLNSGLSLMMVGYFMFSQLISYLIAVYILA